MKNTDSTFNIVTEQFVESYNTFLIQRGVVRNTISFYMRIFRSVYNKAVTQKIIEQTSIQEWIEPENVLLQKR